MPYEFMADDEVSVEDVKRLVSLTLDDKRASDEIIGANLKGMRIGFNPDTRRWHYLRLADGGGEHNYVEGEVTPEMQQAVDALFDLAAASDGGLIAAGVLDVVKIRHDLSL
jgi:hypothetical protein